MSKVLNKAQAMSIMAKLSPPAEAKAEVERVKQHGERLPANAIIARFEKAMEDDRAWTDNCPAGVVYGD